MCTALAVDSDGPEQEKELDGISSRRVRQRSATLRQAVLTEAE